MEVLVPDSSLTMWVFICSTAFIALVAAAIGLMFSNNMSPRLKLSWVILVIIVPILGPILFFYFRKQLNLKQQK